MAKEKAEKKSDNRGGKSNNNLLLYVAALGALLLILVYFFVFQKFADAAEQIQSSNLTLAQRVSELKVYYDAREQYIEATQLAEQLTDELLTAYPADAREEDAILLAVQIQQSSGSTFQSINMERGDVAHTVAAETVAAAGSEKYTQAIEFRQMNATYSNEVSYEGLKNMIQKIFDSSNRIGIRNIAYTAGDLEQPNLTGHMDLVFYSATGTGKEYIAPDITPYLAGTDNIFGVADEVQQ